MVLLWFTTVAVLAMGALAVDLGRVKFVKSELKTAVDSAALAGAANMKNGISAATDAAVKAMSKNKVDKDSMTITSADVAFGVWDPALEDFDKLTGTARSSATAFRVIVKRPGVQTVIGRFVGISSVDIEETSIATRGKIISVPVDGKACPWLAGMPNGSRVNGYGGNPRAYISAPDYSPLQLNQLNVTPGATLYFRDVQGFTTYQGSGEVGPEGDTSWCVQQQSANGINSTKAPIMALMGIFLDGRRPDTYAQAPALDYSIDSKRNAQEMKPLLKQVFYIGDGQDNTGQLQRFVVPDGATRLFVGIMDEKGWWWDNENPLNTTMLDGVVQLVK